MNWQFIALVSLVVWAVISVPIGIIIGRFIAAGAGPDKSNFFAIGDCNDFDDEYSGSWTYEEEYNEERERESVKRNLADAIAYPCPNSHAGIGELCDLPGLWVCLERIDFRNSYEFTYSPYSYTREVGSRTAVAQPGEPGVWRETAMSNCPAGCKIYLNDTTNERVLAHNNTYGCYK